MDSSIWLEMFGIGPPIENGFYYDVDLGDGELSADDLDGITKKMRELAKRDVPFERREVSKKEALDYFEAVIFTAAIAYNDFAVIRYAGCLEKPAEVLIETGGFVQNRNDDADPGLVRQGLRHSYCPDRRCSRNNDRQY